MRTLLVVEGQISPNPPSVLSPLLITLQVYLLVLDPSAQGQPFHDNVVGAAALFVHAHPNALRQQLAGEGLTGELTPLFGAENLRLDLAQGLFQSLDTEAHLQGVGSFSGRTG
jgi:hypothetical protein